MRILGSFIMGSALLACSSATSPKETMKEDAGLIPIVLPPTEDARASTSDAGPDARKGHDDAAGDARVDTGFDATAACSAPDASSSLVCGTLEFTKSKLASRPRNHHLTDLAETKAGPFLYVLGGFGGTEGSIVYPNVDRVAVLADGSLGEWVSETPLPLPVGGATGGVVGSAFVIAGGLGAAGVSATSYSAKIADDGSLGVWNEGGSITNARMHAGTVAVGDRVWILGGFDDQTVWSDIVSASVDADGKLSPWQPAGKLPGPRSHFSISRDGEYVYVAGGLTASAFDNAPDQQDVWRGHFESDGTIGDWKQLVNLLVPAATHASFPYGGYLHVCGGISDAPAQENRCWRAPILSDHTLGAFAEIASLPIARGHVHQMPVLGHSVYSIAGAIDFSLDSTTEIDIGTFEQTPAKMTGKAFPKPPPAPVSPVRKGFKCHHVAGE